MEEREQFLTEEMFFEGSVDLEEPEILSRRDNEYFESYARRLTKSDVESLCKILLYPSEEIFTDEHLKAIMGYGFLKLDGKEHSVGSFRVKDILLGIRDSEWGQNEVLHDTSQLLGKHKPDELSLKVSVLNHLINEGFIRLKR